MQREQGLSQIRHHIEDVRDALLRHRVYRQIDSLPALRVFMRHHVFAVWDFMALLKGLQRGVTWVDVPWIPPADRLGCRLVNEIVLGEESDEDGRGGYASHFELYLRSMRQCQASTACIDRFVERLRAGQPPLEALAAAEVPQPVHAFVGHTFEVLARNDLPVLAAVFTFGREDLLPDVFERIVDELNDVSGGDLSDFVYYLQRHVQLDGDHHGPLAQQLIANLCGDDPAKWEQAAVAARATLSARLALWDGIGDAIDRLDR